MDDEEKLKKRCDKYMGECGSYGGKDRGRGGRRGEGVMEQRVGLKGRRVQGRK